MANTNSGAVTLRTIGELSDKVVTNWQVKYADLIKKRGTEILKFTQVIPTLTEGANLPYKEGWKRLEKIGLNERPSYETVIAQYSHREIARYAKGLECSVIGFDDPTKQALLMNELDALVADAATTRPRRIFQALAGGDTDTQFTGVDGLQIFANNHVINGTTFDNLRTGDLTGANLQAAIDVLRQVPAGPGGEYLNTDGAAFSLIIPNQLEIEAAQILNGTVIHEATYNSKNPYQNIAQKIQTGWLTDADDWYVMMEIPGLTPFVTIESNKSNGGALQPFIADSYQNVYEYKKYRWLVDLFEETYPLIPWMMVKYTNS